MGEINIKLKDYIDSRGITRYRLADDTGIRYATISDYYNNHVKTINVEHLIIICDYLNCSIDDILEYVPTKNENS